jgi:hypothetical protein
MQAAAMLLQTRRPRVLSEDKAGETLYWVPARPSSSARAIRDALLQTYFGYLPEDIAELDRLEGFVISDRGSKSNAEATPAQVRTWRRDSQGRVAVTLSRHWIEQLERVKRGRAEREVLRALVGVFDPELRTLMQSQLVAILSGPPEDRASALTTLTNALRGARERVPATRAIDLLERLGGYRDDPYLALVKADLSLVDAKTLAGPGYTERTLAHVEETLTKLAQSPRALGREDVAAINAGVARIYRELGDDDRASHREWITRFSRMTSSERALYEEGDIVEITAPGERFMAAPSATQRRLDALDQARAERLRQEEAINRIGARSVTNADRDNSLTRDVREIQMSGVTVRKKRGNGPGYHPRLGYTTTTVPLMNPQREAAFSRASGTLSLMSTTLKFVAAHRRMTELAEYMNQREALVRQEQRQRARVVPPKPAKIQATIDALLAADRRTRDPKAKEEIGRVLLVWRALLEESKAAWPEP